MKHLKLFNQVSEYETYMDGDEVVLPNVSYVKDGEVYYNPSVEPSSSYIAVDLGLPSGRLWADRNIGATSPEDYGLYFQWGDTIGYTAEQVANGEKVFSSDWSDYFDTTDGYTFNKYSGNFKLKVLEASDDAASVNMGSDWRMPTQAETQELIDNTTFTFIDLQGNEFSKSETESGAITIFNLKGVKFTGSNGNSIFIPASGYYKDSAFARACHLCYAWSSDLSNWNDEGWILYFDGFGYLEVGSVNRYLGLPVRGVR